jgi:hypothetical protein
MSKKTENSPVKSSGLLKLVIACTVMLIALFVSIILKFNLLTMPGLAPLNLVLYVLSYYIAPAAIFIWLAPFVALKNGNPIKNWLLFIGVLIAMFSWAYIFTILPDYLAAALPFGLILIVYLWQSSSLFRTRKSFGFIIVVAFVISIFLPYIGAFLGYYSVKNHALSISGQEQQVTFIANTGLTVTGDVPIIIGYGRAYDNFFKFLLSGGGRCGETSMWEIEILKDIGFDARKIVFPGEDHAFVEVKTNSTWKVVDPGYSIILVSRTERAERRVQEAGTISYVSAYLENGFVELTPEYVKTDTIIIRVIQQGEPLAGASVTLTHTLVTDGNSRTQELPGNGLTFQTDTNGTVTLHIGQIQEDVYIKSFIDTQPFYLVQINGKTTSLEVISTGTGITTELEIDITP